MGSTINSTDRPIITVQATPHIIQHGKQFTIDCRLFHPVTLAPFIVPNIYMLITSTKGHVVWPLEVVRHDAPGFSIQVGTKDMERDQTYHIRVSNHKNLSPIGATDITVQGNPLLLLPIPITPNMARREVQDIIEKLEKRKLTDDDAELVKKLKDWFKKKEGPVDDPDKKIADPRDDEPDIEKYIFRTQMDHRVCPLCKKHENEEFGPNADRPEIPIHPRCRCTYDVVYANRLRRTAALLRLAQVVQTARVARRAFRAVRAVQLAT